MVEDLKQQASELYKERSPTEAIPSSDGHFTKKLVYLSLALVVVILVFIYAFGGFRRRPNPVEAAYTPPPLIKEAPPPELMDPVKNPPAPPLEQAQPAPPQAVPPAAKREPSEQPKTSAEPPAPKQARDAAQTRAKSAPPAPKKEAAAAPIPAPPPEPPKLSDIEIARRELARDIVIEKNAALAKLIESPQNKGWSAEPEGTDGYQVTFNVLDDSTGTPVQYVWRVTLSTRTATPLSYYARKLS
jgi:hypothetical protein